MASGTVLRAGGNTLLGTCKTYSSFPCISMSVLLPYMLHLHSLLRDVNRMYHLLSGWSILLATTAPKFCFLCSFCGRQHKTIRVLCIFLLKTVKAEETASNNVHMCQICQQDEFASIQFKSAQFSSVYTEYCRNEITTKVASKHLCCKQSTKIQSDKVEQQ